MAALFILAGSTFLAVALWVGKKHIKLIRHGIKATGFVVAIHRRESSNDDGISVSYHPEIEFTDKEGNKHVFVSSVGSFNPVSWTKGDKVEIIYLPGDEKNAKINKPLYLFLIPGIFGFIGLTFLIVGILMLGK